MATRQISNKMESGELQKICLRGGTDTDDEVLTRAEINSYIGEVIDRMRWAGPYDQGLTYEVQEVVKDGPWLMVANKQTNDRAAPYPIGDPFYVYQGSSMVPDTEVGVKQVVIGTRYHSTEDFYIDGYRVLTVAGQTYEMLVVSDPFGVAAVNYVGRYIADTAEWVSFGLVPRPVAAGTTFDVIIIITKTDTSPTETTLDYNYLRPQNPGTPNDGEVQHPNNSPEVLRFNYLDNSLVDQSALLTSLAPGDKIDVGGLVWSIQSVNDVPASSFVEYIIAPALHATGSGVLSFTFMVEEEITVTYDYEADYYLADPNVSGLFVANDDWNNAVANDNAYGIDLLIQHAHVSPDWDMMAYSSISSAATVTEFKRVSELEAKIPKTYITTSDLGPTLTVAEIEGAVTDPLPLTAGTTFYIQTPNDKYVIQWDGTSYFYERLSKAS